MRGTPRRQAIERDFAVRLRAARVPVTVDFSLEGNQVVLLPRRDGRPLGGRFAGSGMADRLLEDRRREPR